MANTIEAYGNRHNLTICEKTQNLKKLERCRIANTHAASLDVTLAAKNVSTWFGTVPVGDITVILFREPRERCLSLYFYRLAWTHHQLWDGNWSKVADTDFPYGDSWAPSEYLAFLGRGSIRSALENIHLFHVVGITENMTAAIASLVVHLHCVGHARAFAFENVKVVVGRPTYNDTPAYIRQRLDASTAADLTIYESARNLSEQRVSEYNPRVWASVYNAVGNGVFDDCGLKDNRSDVNFGFECLTLKR